MKYKVEKTPMRIQRIKARIKRLMLVYSEQIANGWPKSAEMTKRSIDALENWLD